MKPHAHAVVSANDDRPRRQEQQRHVLYQLHNKDCELARNSSSEWPMGFFWHDPTALGLPEYEALVKEPMWMQRVLDQVADRQRDYSWENFWSDLVLMCKNAMKYNKKTTPPYETARELLQLLKRLRKVEVEVEEGTGAAQRPSDGLPPTRPLSSLGKEELINRLPSTTRDIAVDKRWSCPKVLSWLERDTNPNAFYYWHLPEGEQAQYGAWTEEELDKLQATCQEEEVNLQGLFPGWGIISLQFPGRVGYQCRDAYHRLCRRSVCLRKIKDQNYSENGKSKSMRRCRAAVGPGSEEPQALGGQPDMNRSITERSAVKTTAAHRKQPQDPEQVSDAPLIATTGSFLSDEQVAVLLDPCITQHIRDLEVQKAQAVEVEDCCTAKAIETKLTSLWVLAARIEQAERKKQQAFAIEAFDEAEACESLRESLKEEARAIAQIDGGQASKRIDVGAIASAAAVNEVLATNKRQRCTDCAPMHERNNKAFKRVLETMPQSTAPQPVLPSAPSTGAIDPFVAGLSFGHGHQSSNLQQHPWTAGAKTHVHTAAKRLNYEAHQGDRPMTANPSTSTSFLHSSPSRHQPLDHFTSVQSTHSSFLDFRTLPSVQPNPPLGDHDHGPELYSQPQPLRDPASVNPLGATEHAIPHQSVRTSQGMPTPPQFVSKTAPHSTAPDSQHPLAPRTPAPAETSALPLVGKAKRLKFIPLHQLLMEGTAD
uniref:Bromo domain-containing protein n=1 Tax=Eutreptiella gymnastica TaxID=73025 RepID=A0A7S1HXX4_9EUGL